MSRPAPLAFSRLFLPRPLDASRVESLLVRLASDSQQFPLVLEARGSGHADATSVGYWLGTTAGRIDSLCRTVRDLLPGTAFDHNPSARPAVTQAVRVQLRSRGLAFDVDHPEPVATAILSGLSQQLDAGEELVLQILLGPHRAAAHQPAHLPDPHQPWWQLLLTGSADATPPVRKQHDQRALQAGFATCIRIGVRTSHQGRARKLLRGLLGGLSSAKTASTHLRARSESADHLNTARAPWRWGAAPAAAELVGLLAWPLGESDLPGVTPLHPRVLPASAALAVPIEPDRVFGISNLPGDAKPIGLAAADSLYHFIATGPTGSGKSTALLHLIRADIAAGRPVVVLDPKRQLIDDIVERAVPETRIGDVVIIDPALDRVPGFNPLDIGHRDPDVVVDGLLAVLAAVFRDGWGPRTQDILHSTLVTLARVAAQHTETPAAFTLLDVPRLLLEPPFRRSVIGHVTDDPAVGQFWAWYEALSPASAAAILAPVLNKLRQYLLRPSVRRILGQPQPAFRLRDVFRDNKIVLVPLNEALIGPITAQLLGGLIVAETWAATLERATEPAPTTRPASVWVDEVQNYLHLPTSLDAALNASRSMGVGWHLAHQFRSQLPPAMLAAVDSNARTKLVFRVNDPKDGAAFARHTPDLDAVDFLTLPQYTAYATVVAGGASQPWCSLTTLPPPPTTGLGSRIRAASLATYGAATAVAPVSVPSAATAPHPTASVEVIGRKRRPPEAPDA